MRTNKTYQLTIADLSENFDNLNTTGQAQFYLGTPIPQGKIVKIDLLFTPNIVNDAGTTNAIYGFNYFGAVGNSQNGILAETEIEIFAAGQTYTEFVSCGYVYLWFFLNVNKGLSTDVLILNPTSKLFIKFTFED